MTHRPSGRQADEMRQVVIQENISQHAEGSCMIEFGNTKVLCTASLDTKIPHWLRDQGKGWVTAEYGMLPRSTGQRMRRESALGKQSGRTQEIQRLIGRSLRAVIDLEKLGEHVITLDCDVIQADGGTRTASITGAFVALHQCITYMMDKEMLSESPLTDNVAAVSCGLYKGEPVLDLDYDEDSNAEVDANFILTGRGHIVEIQATAEDKPFDNETFAQLMALAQKGTRELTEIQSKACNSFAFLSQA